MKRIIINLAFSALALCACSRMETPEQKEAPVVYHLSFQASVDPQTKGISFGIDGMSISSRFMEGDKIYLYNITKDVLASPLVLTAGMIQNEGRNCTVEGDLTFVKWNDVKNEWEAISPDAEDGYELYYQLNDPSPRFYYINQDGSKDAASEHDFAVATGVKMNLVGKTLSAQGAVMFTNMQSMFRQQLIFKNSKNETVTPTTIEKLSITSKQGTLVNYNTPTTDEYTTSDKIDIDNPVLTEGNVYLSLSFYYPDEDAKNDVFGLTAIDDKGNLYSCSKKVPAGGFQNGKYYYGNCEMTWQEKNNLATVEASDLGNIIASNGHIYADVATANMASTAEAMIVFVGSVDGVCEHGLAISLTDVYEYNATYEQATGAVIIPGWAAAHPISGGSWRLPSEKDWQYMMWGSYTASPSVTKVNADLCTLLDNNSYFWTSDSVDAGNAKAIYFKDTYASVASLAKTGYYRVRACLAF